MGKNEKLLQEESEILSNKLSLIKDQMRKNDKIAKDYSLEDINTYKKVDEWEYYNTIKNQKDLKAALNNPYYGRLDIEYKDDNDVKNIYIGTKKIDIGDDTIVYSWAAPIADIYQTYNSGEYKETCYDKKKGKEIILSGNIKEKRKITINKSKVIDVYSYTNVTKKDEEKFVRDKVENSDTEKLGVIIETVQRDQNLIIRLPIEKNVLVQGCAGSGKSSVAFHRLAYLAYNYNLDANELLVISPNKIFQGYTSNILMELGTDFNVQQFTFKEFAEMVLQIKIQNKVVTRDEVSRECAQLKTCKMFKDVLDNYVKNIEDNYIPKENVVIDDFELINSNDISSIWFEQFGNYKLNDRIEKIKVYLEKYLRDKAEEYIIVVEKRYKNNIDILAKYNKSPVIYNELLKLTREEKEIRIKRLRKQCSAVINGYINNLNKISAVDKYEQLLKDRSLITSLSKDVFNISNINVILSDSLDNLITDIDCIPIMYLYYKINENKNKYRHIVIDECQDLSFIEIAVIEGLTKSFTLVGDFNQQIRINKSTVSLDEIKDLFKKYTFFESYYLNKSFRNSMSITNYANAILEKYFIDKQSIPIAFNRETEKPKVYLKMNKSQTLKSIAESINKYKEQKNIAIILKTEASARQYYNELFALMNGQPINLIDNEYCKYEKGINILSARLSKGLEFDYVFIVNANEYEDNEEDRRLLYIATTRALHALEIYSENNYCFITTIKNNLWDNKIKLSINVGMKNFIKKTLTDGFGELPQEYIQYIDSMNNINDLTKFASKLDELEDIHELFESEGIITGLKKLEKETVNISRNEDTTFKNKHKISNIEKLIIDLKNRENYLTGKQLDVYDYVIKNIIELPKYKNCRELADKLGVSTTTITMMFMKLNVGTFGNFVSMIKDCIKNDSKK